MLLVKFKVDSSGLFNNCLLVWWLGTMVEEGSKGWQEFCSENSRFAGGLSGWVNRLTVMGSLNGRDREKAARGSGTEGGSDPETASKCSFSRQEKKSKSLQNYWWRSCKSTFIQLVCRNKTLLRRQKEALLVRHWCVCLCVCVASKIYGALFARFYSIKAKGRIFITLKSTVGQIRCYSLGYANLL